MSDPRRTLLFLVKDGQILLALKKRGFGVGLLNGVGGKIDSGETIEQAMIRECQEEIGVTPTKYRKVAELDFKGGSTPEGWNMYGYVYIASAWQSEPCETEEMAPKWYSTSDIPYEKMWQDDKYWLPIVLTGKTLHGEFTFDEKDNLTSHKIIETDEF